MGKSHQVRLTDKSISLEYFPDLPCWCLAGTSEVRSSHSRFSPNATKGVSEEQQLRFAFLQVGEVVVLASGNIANFGVSNSFQVSLGWCYPLMYIHPIPMISLLANLPGQVSNLFFCDTPYSSMCSIDSPHTVEPSEWASRLKRLAVDVFGPGIGISPCSAKSIRSLHPVMVNR